jgi:hypothetical protein
MQPNRRPPLTGCDDTREWLVAQGFRCWENTLRSEGNDCNWYACRRSELPARECECNDGKAMQLVVYPTSYDLKGETHESVKVDVTGEASGLWFNLSAYSMSVAELKEHLPDIERMLIAAWNAMLPATETPN